MKYLPVINQTEARELCASAGLPLSLHASPEQAEQVLLGEASSQSEIDPLRDSLMQFILAHWRTLRAQLACPASSGDPRSCYQCPDIRVLVCINTQNPVNRETILNGTPRPPEQP